MRLGTEAAERGSGAHNLVDVRQLRSAGDVIAYKRKTENEVHGTATTARKVAMLRRSDGNFVHCLIIERAEPMMKKFITVSTRD